METTLCGQHHASCTHVTKKQEATFVAIGIRFDSDHIAFPIVLQYLCEVEVGTPQPEASWGHFGDRRGARSGS